MQARWRSPAVFAVVLVVIIGTTGGILGFSAGASAQDSVLVDSDITSDTTWESGTGPYRIVTSVTVTDGSRLTVEPGVTVEIAEDVTLTVDGSLRAVGTEDSRVVFTSSKTDPTPGSWGTIELGGPYSRVHQIEHATIEYATDGLTLGGGQRALLENVEVAHASEAGIAGSPEGGFGRSGELQLTSSHVHHNNVGIRGYDERYTVTDSTIDHNTGPGIEVTNSLDLFDIRVQDSRLANNDIGISLESGVDEHNRGGVISETVIFNNTIENNAGMGVRIFGDRLMQLRLADNRIEGNGGSGAHLQDTGRAGGAKPSRNITVTDNRLAHNGNRGVIVDAAYSSMTAVDITENTALDNGAAGIRVEADRDLWGVEVGATSVQMNGETGVEIGGATVRDITLSDLTVFANGEDGVAVTATDLAAIEVTDTQSSLNGQAGIRVDGPNQTVVTSIRDVVVGGNEDGIALSGHPAMVNQSAIVYNNGSGIDFREPNGTTLISTTDIYGNGAGLSIPEDASELVVDAKDAFWGAGSGPYHASINPEGEGDIVTGGLENVEFLPYAESSYMEVNEPPTPAFEEGDRSIVNGSAVTFSGAASTDDGTVEWYRFSFNTSSDTGLSESASVTRTFESTGIHKVELSVVDDWGVPSESNATVLVNVTEPVEETNEPNTTTTTTESGSESSNGGSSGSDDQTESTTTTTETRLPGFGIPVALIAVLLGLGLASRFRSS